MDVGNLSFEELHKQRQREVECECSTSWTDEDMKRMTREIKCSVQEEIKPEPPKQDEWPKNAMSPKEYANVYGSEFDWLGDCDTFEEAISCLQVGMNEMDPKHYGKLIEQSKNLILEFDDRIEEMSQSHAKPDELPTEKDIEELSGIYLHPSDGRPWHVYPETVAARDPDDLRATLSGLEKIEPMPPLPDQPEPPENTSSSKIQRSRCSWGGVKR
jgi:hypothetical protein